MCFSATASFGVGIALCATSIPVLKKVTVPKQYAFASIPLIFGAQQIIEGFVWLSLSNPAYSYWAQTSTHAFLIFAQAVWPIWVPLSIMLMEENTERKRVLKLLLGIGVAVAAFLMFAVFSKTTVAEIQEHHIVYKVTVPAMLAISSGLPYFIATVIPAFISSVKGMKWLAWAALISLLVSKIYFEQYLVSVWCFFAAVISVVVYMILARAPRLQSIAVQRQV